MLAPSFVDCNMLLCAALTPHLHPCPSHQQSLNRDTVSLDAAQLTGNGQVVTVSWDLGTSGAHSSDTIALYLAPVNTTFATSYPIKYKKAGTASGSARWGWGWGRSGRSAG